MHYRSSETVSPSQIPLLLSIDEQDKALSKAVESGDTDLVYLVLFHIWQKVAVEKVNHLIPLEDTDMLFVIGTGTNIEHEHLLICQH